MGRFFARTYWITVKLDALVAGIWSENIDPNSIFKFDMNIEIRTV